MSSTFLALTPVLFFIATGLLVARNGWLGPVGIAEISNLVFLVLVPALLFRTMSHVQLDQLDYEPVVPYFMAVAVIFGGTLIAAGLNARGAVLALANTFSNTVLIGIPLVTLVFGKAGQTTLFTLVSIHSVVLMTAGTLVLESVSASAANSMWEKLIGVLQVLRKSIFHPIPMPIFLGLALSVSGMTLPGFIDHPLQLFGDALSPLALILVGASLYQGKIAARWRGAGSIALTKNLLHPVLVTALGLLFGLRGVPFAVMIATAALPVGANVYLFAKRYNVEEDTITAGVAMSTLLAMLTLPLALVAGSLLTQH